MASRSKKSSVLTFVLTFFITLLLLGGASFLAKDFLVAVFTGDTENIGEALPWTGGGGWPSETLLAQTDYADESYLDGIVFVGDSRTNGMMKYGFIEEGQTFAVDGINHRDIQEQKFVYLDSKTSPYTLAEAIEIKQPEIIMVALGINGVAFMAEDDFMAEYENLIDLLQESSPDSKVIIEAILPVSSSKEKSDPRMKNTIIDAYNDRLYSLAQQKGCYFLDWSDELKDSNNALAKEYDSGDGLHLNTSAYEVLMDYIMTHALVKS